MGQVLIPNSAAKIDDFAIEGVTADTAESCLVQTS